MGAEPDRVLVAVGDIRCTQHSVTTRNGTYPLRDTTWSVTDHTATTSHIPVWAIVCTIVFFIFCLLGLLFLLAKEQQTVGFVEVTVSGPCFFDSTQIPCPSLAAVADVSNRVNYINSLVAWNQQLPG